MSCDMWLYHVRKCKPSFVKRAQSKRSNDLELGMARDDTECESDMPASGHIIHCVDITEDLATCADKVTLIDSEIDWDKLRKRYNIPKDACQTGSHFGPYDISITFAIPAPDDSDPQKITIDLTRDEFDRFFTDIETDYWLCDAREIARYSNFQELRDLLYANIDIQNCGFHNVSDNAILDGIEALDEDIIIPRLHPNEAIIYHEWY